MKEVFYCLLLLNFEFALAQTIPWSEGSLVMHNDEVLVGEIYVEDNHDLVLYQHESQRMVYPAHLIKAIHFHDKEANVNRRFVCLAGQNLTRTEYLLYEVVVPGEIPVLRRRKASASSNHRDVLDYNYFVRYNYSLMPLRKFASAIFPHILTGTDKILKRFISENRLKPYRVASAIRIIEFYNMQLSTGSLEQTAALSRKNGDQRLRQ